LESLYHPPDGEIGISACGNECPHAKRRETLNQLGAHPMQIHEAMQAFSMPPTLPPPQAIQQQQTQQASYNIQYGVVQPSHNAAALGEAHFNTSQITPPPLPAMQPYQGNLNSVQPPPFNPPAKQEENFGSMNPLPYLPEQLTSAAMADGSIATGPTVGPNSYLNSHVPSVVSAPASYQTSFEPLPYETPGLHRSEPMSDRGVSTGSVFSLRKFCSEDFNMTSDEGKVLMDQLNQEVDDIIRRKSVGLIQIDMQAFEDLVFDEDSMMLDDDQKQAAQGESKQDSYPVKRVGRKSDSSSTNRSRHSSLSIKDDMSLMNMSILSLDDIEGSGLTEGNGHRRSSYKKSDPSIPRDIKKTRVSFAGKNISLMSMDDRSFSQLVDAVADPEGDGDTGRKMSGSSSDSLQSFARKVGFPMRPTVAQKFEAVLAGGDKEGSPLEAVSGLSIPEDFPVKSEFSTLAGQVENPQGVLNSLTLDTSLQNVNDFNVSDFTISNMSLSDAVEDLIK